MAANVLAQAGLSIASEVGNALLGEIMGAIFGDPEADLLEVAEKQLTVAEDQLKVAGAQLEVAGEQLEVAKEQLEVAKEQLKTAQMQLEVAKEALSVLKEINTTLDGVKDELSTVNDNLREIQNTLNKNFKTSQWSESNASLKIHTDKIAARFTEFKAFITLPRPDTQTGKQRMPKYHNHAIPRWKETVSSTMTDASTAIHTAITGSTGILSRWADVIVSDIVYPNEKRRNSAKRGQAIYSAQLSVAISRLTAYYKSLLLARFHATIMLMEVDNLPDDQGEKNSDAAYIKRQNFLRDIEDCHSSYFSAIAKIIFNWVSQIDDVIFPGMHARRKSGFEVVETYDKENKLFSKLDLQALSTLLAGGASGFDLGKGKQTQPWLLEAEQLVSAFSLDTTRKGRFVVHGFALSGVHNDNGMEIVMNKMKEIRKNNTNLLKVFLPANGSFPTNTTVKTSLYQTRDSLRTTSYAFLRQVIDTDFTTSSDEPISLGVEGHTVLIDTERTITLGFGDVPDSKTHEFAEDITAPGLTSSKYASFMGPMTKREFSRGTLDFMPFTAFDSGSRRGLDIILPNELTEISLNNAS